MGAALCHRREESVAVERATITHGPIRPSILGFSRAATPVLFLPVIIAWWKGRPIVPIALLSLAFWPGALILALRLRRRMGICNVGDSECLNDMSTYDSDQG